MLTSSAKRSISVVVPVYHEADRINSLIGCLEQINYAGSFQVIVVDGGQGDTISAIESDSVIKIKTDKGRALQLNAGAAQATGDVVLFLHADTILPDGAFDAIADLLDDKSIVGGAFDLGIETQSRLVKFFAGCSRARNRLLKTPYGDQAIFLRRDYFEHIGRFKRIDLMEDVELMRRIKKHRDKIVILKERVTTSDRRWQNEGVWFCTLRNLFIVTLYYLGADPNSLTRFYRSDYGKSN